MGSMRIIIGYEDGDIAAVDASTAREALEIYENAITAFSPVVRTALIMCGTRSIDEDELRRRAGDERVRTG